MMDAFNKYAGRTEGADKVFRVLGYFLRIVVARRPSKSLAAIVSALSECRVLLRFFGLPQTISWLQSTLGQCDAEERRLQLLQIASMLIYYPLEHIYYLSGKGLVSVGNRYELSRWSCRMWFFYMALDILQLYRQHKDRLLCKVNDDDDGDKALTKARLKLIATLADMPLALTWSMANGFLSDYQIGVLGTISSIAGIINSTIQ